MRGRGAPPAFLDALFQAELKTRSVERLGPRLAERLAAGGYPAALVRATPRRRAAWYRAHVETIVQRDVRDLRHIEDDSHAVPVRALWEA